MSQVVQVESRAASIRQAKQSGVKLKATIGDSLTEPYNRGWNVIANYTAHLIRLINPDAIITIDGHTSQDLTAKVAAAPDTTPADVDEIDQLLNKLHNMSLSVCGGCGRDIVFDEAGHSQYSCTECPAVLKHIGRILSDKGGAPSPNHRRNAIIGITVAVLAAVAAIIFVIVPAFVQMGSFFHDNSWILPIAFVWVIFGAAIYGILSIFGINRALKITAAIIAPIGIVVVIAFLYARNAGRMIK